MLLAVALVLSSVGFVPVVYFISIGYGLAVSGMVLAIFIGYFDRMTVLAALHCAGLAIYGLRLAWFLSLRELRASYRGAAEIRDRSARRGPGPEAVDLARGVVSLCIDGFAVPLSRDWDADVA